MEIHIKKNQAAEIMFPMVDSASPASLKSGLSVTDTAYYKDGAGAWTSLGITAAATEIASTGMYAIAMTAAELNHDLIMIKVSASGAAESVVIIRTFDVDIEDLVRSTTPANTLDIESGGTVGIDFSNVNGTHPTVPTVTNVTNDVGITQAGADKVWSTATRTLTSFGTLVSDIWSNATRTLTGFGTLIADIWANATRTLTAGTKDSEIDAIKAKTDQLPADTNAAINRVMGLSYENTYQHTRVYSAGKLTNSKMDLYNSKANAQTHDGATGIVAKYTMTFTYSGSELATMQVVRDS